MRAVRSKLSYANVIATIALFLALAGGTVYAATKIRSSQLAKNAVKKKQLAPKSVTVKDFGKKSLLVADASGGGQGANIEATPPATGFPIPLNGKATFTAKKGEAGLLMSEARASLSSVVAGTTCQVFITILVNGQPVYTLFPDNDPFGPADPTTSPYTAVDSGSAPIGLAQPGVPQVISAQYDGDTDCAPGSAISQLRIVVQRSV